MTAKKMTKTEIRLTAYREAAALLAADCDSADLQCESTQSEEDASAVREYIRDTIVGLLDKKGQLRGAVMTARTNRELAALVLAAPRVTQDEDALYATYEQLFAEAEQRGRTAERVAIASRVGYPMTEHFSAPYYRAAEVARAKVKK